MKYFLLWLSTKKKLSFNLHEMSEIRISAPDNIKQLVWLALLKLEGSMKSEALFFCWKLFALRLISVIGDKIFLFSRWAFIKTIKWFLEHEGWRSFMYSLMSLDFSFFSVTRNRDVHRSLFCKKTQSLFNNFSNISSALFSLMIG